MVAVRKLAAIVSLLVRVGANVAANSEQIASMFRAFFSSESADRRTNLDFSINDTAGDGL
jgi:hypothetical protein